MNLEIKTQWLAALRSGKYQQGRGVLRNSDNEFCCLGVLCDLYSKETGTSWTEEEGECFHMRGMRSLPPKEVAEWAGMSMAESYGELKSGIDLVHLNDGEKLSFWEIAKVIEKHL